MVTRAFSAFALLAITVLAAPAAAQLIRFGTEVRCSAARRPVLGTNQCIATQSIRSGTVPLPGTRYFLNAVDPGPGQQSSSSFTFEHLGDGFSAEAVVTASSVDRTLSIARLSDGSQPCGSGFPAILEIVPPQCAFDLVVDACNSGGEETSVRIQAVRGSVLQTIFLWDTGTPTSRGCTSQRLSLSNEPLLVVSIYAIAQATAGSGTMRNSVSTTIRIEPRGPACSSSLTKTNCDPYLFAIPGCGRTLDFGVSASTFPLGTAFLFFGAVSAPLPLLGCELLIAAPIPVAVTTLDAAGIGAFPAIPVPANLSATGSFQAACIDAVGSRVELTWARPTMCP